MFDRLTQLSPVAWSSLASLAAMLALNIFAINEQMSAMPRIAAPSVLIEGGLA